MPSEPSPHERFIARMKTVTPDVPLDEGVEQAGLDMWSREGSALESTERHAVFDPASGDAAELVEFQSAALPPAAFPANWPFVPDADCVFSTVTAGGRAICALLWPVEGDRQALVDAVTAAMAEQGWHMHTPTAPALDPQTELLLWFHRKPDWRLLLYIPALHPPHLTLSDYRPDLSSGLPAAVEEPPAGAV